MTAPARVHFLDEQRRHRRTSAESAALVVVVLAISGIPLSVLISPILVAAAAVPIYLADLVFAKLDIATGNMALVAPTGLFGVVGNYPIYDPTGKTIFYVDNTYKTIKRFIVLNLATKVTKRLTWNGAADQSPSWSPDGTKLAFASYRTGKMQIWTMNSSTGGSLTRITSRTYGAAWPAWVR